MYYELSDIDGNILDSFRDAANAREGLFAAGSDCFLIVYTDEGDALEHAVTVDDLAAAPVAVASPETGTVKPDHVDLTAVLPAKSSTEPGPAGVKYDVRTLVAS